MLLSEQEGAATDGGENCTPTQDNPTAASVPGSVSEQGRLSDEVRSPRFDVDGRRRVAMVNDARRQLVQGRRSRRGTLRPQRLDLQDKICQHRVMRSRCDEIGIWPRWSRRRRARERNGCASLDRPRVDRERQERQSPREEVAGARNAGEPQRPAFKMPESARSAVGWATSRAEVLGAGVEERRRKGIGVHTLTSGRSRSLSIRVRTGGDIQTRSRSRTLGFTSPIALTRCAVRISML